MTNHEAAVREYDLVQRSLSGDQEAWRLLFQDQQPRLLAKVRQLLGPMRRHDDLAEEVAARVWVAAVADDYRLLRAFDPRRGRLGTFLGRRAFFETLAVLRARSRQSRREGRYRHDHAERAELPALPQDLLWPEILARLTDAERTYLLETLLDGSAAARSLAPMHRLRDCIRLKILAYLKGA